MFSFFLFKLVGDIYHSKNPNDYRALTTPEIRQYNSYIYIGDKSPLNKSIISGAKPIGGKYERML